MTNKIRIVLVVATLIILSAITIAERIAVEDIIKNEGKSSVFQNDSRGEIIDNYFKNKGMPLAGYGAEFVEAADRYSIDWRVLPAISVIESTGGKHMCGNNPFGWGSCRSGVGDFESISEAIDYVSMNLGGQNPRTRSAYSGDTSDDLWSYNGTVDHTYPNRVMRVMSELKETPLP